MRTQPEVAEVRCHLGVGVGDRVGNVPYLPVALPEPKSGTCVLSASSVGVFCDTSVCA